MKHSTSLNSFVCRHTLLVLSLFVPHVTSTNNTPDLLAHPRFICTPLPADADPACLPNADASVSNTAAGAHGQTQNAPLSGWWGASEEAKATILHLRESLVQQKETILDQRETIRELTAKLALCEGFGHTTNNDHHQHHNSHHASGLEHHSFADNGHYSSHQGHQGNHDSLHLDGGNVKEKYMTPGDSGSSLEQSERMLQSLKERLENLQKRNTSVTYSSSLKELLQRKISALEQQLHHHTGALFDHHHDDKNHSHNDHQDDHHHDDQHHDDDHHDDDHHDNSDDHHSQNGRHEGHDHEDDDYDDAQEDDRQDHHDDDHRDIHHDNEADNGFVSRTAFRVPGPHTGFHANKLETMLNQLHLTGPGRMKSPDDFLVSFPMRTNYMYGRVKKTLLQEIFALTLCLWIKPGMGPGLGTPFSYSAPGQSNEIVLIEWGNNPIEFLIDDKAVTLPLTLTDGKWHHVCVTWTTRDGHWEAYQDGVQRGSGVNLSSWHPIKPGGVFILGQEQDTLGGRFDATQSFVGEMSEVNLWSHVLTSSEIDSLSSCSSHLEGDIFAWTEGEVELHGGVTRHPFNPCH